MIALRVLLSCALVLAMTGTASADDCPLGSTEKKENGVTWCEPSICQTDTQCPTGMLCKPVSLCVEIGTVDKAAGDAGNRLIARQRCGENQSCPQNTTCNTAGRCLSPTQASSLPVPASSAAAPTEAPKKSSCGCELAGSPTPFGGVLAAIAFGTFVARRKRR